MVKGLLGAWAGLKKRSGPPNHLQLWRGGLEPQSCSMDPSPSLKPFAPHTMESSESSGLTMKEWHWDISENSKCPHQSSEPTETAQSLHWDNSQKASKCRNQEQKGGENRVFSLSPNGWS